MRSKSARNNRIFCVIPGSAGCQPAVAGSLPATFDALTPRCSVPGSARVSRVGKGVSPLRTFREDCVGETPKPTRETRALSGIIAQHV